MITSFMKRLAAAVVASHVVIVTGIQIYKKQRQPPQSAQSSIFKKKSDEEKLVEWLSDVDGVPLIKDIATNVKKLHNFETRDNDVFIISYPKSGTTWLSELVYHVIHDINVEKAKSKTLDERVPYLEWVYSDRTLIDSMPHDSPRIIKSHLPFKLLPKQITNGKHKIIYIMRNPRDVCVSYYHFTRMIQVVGYTGSFHEFFQLFLKGRVSYGDWCEHVQGYYDLLSQPDRNILYITYEELLKEPIRSIERLTSFLNKPMTAHQIKLLSSLCSFNNMRDNPASNYQWLEATGFLVKGVPFLRKGTVGDWKNYFSSEMVSSLDRLVSNNITDEELRRMIDYKEPV